MPKLSVMFTALVVGLCFAQSDAYPQTDEDAPSDGTYEPEAAIQAEPPLGLTRNASWCWGIYGSSGRDV